MSEIRLNLIDSQQILVGTIHGSIGDACVAALSAEPETIAELECALARFQKLLDDRSPFGFFHKSQTIDERPYDAGIVILDLAARIVASESTYSQPGHTGEVRYHDGRHATEVLIYFQLPDDWVFLNSIEEYRGVREEQFGKRTAMPPLDTRAILYGRPLLEFIAQSVTESMTQTSVIGNAQLVAQTSVCADAQSDTYEESNAEHQLVSAIHATWLMTPRDDLRGQSPRQVLLAKQHFIDYDLNSREMQWSLLREGPPCIPTASFAYKFAGFGTHEWVVYYDLFRFLLSTALESQSSSLLLNERPEPVNKKCKSDEDLSPDANHRESPNTDQGEYSTSDQGDARSADQCGRPGQGGSLSTDQGEWPKDLESQIALLEELKTDWLEHPSPEFDGGIPVLYIENERKRLPLAMSGQEMIIDENCPTCQMMTEEMSAGSEVGFEHLDGSHMDQDFAFSNFLTREEWEADRRKWEVFHEQSEREHPEPSDISVPSEGSDPF